jgi:HK97 gp10 family phage protein
MEITIDVEGVEAVVGALNLADGKIKEGAAAGVAEGGKIVEAAAKGMAPVRTGALRGSISSSAAGLTAIVFAGVHYAPYVEFGTYKMAAQPYMAPALSSSASAVISAIAAKISI